MASFSFLIKLTAFYVNRSCADCTLQAQHEYHEYFKGTPEIQAKRLRFDEKIQGQGRRGKVRVRGFIKTSLFVFNARIAITFERIFRYVNNNYVIIEQNVRNLVFLMVPKIINFVQDTIKYRNRIRGFH